MEASQIEDSEANDEVDTEDDLQKSVCCPYEFTREKIGPTRSLEDVERQTLCAFGTNARQALEFLDQAREGIG